MACTRADLPWGSTLAASVYRPQWCKNGFRECIHRLSRARGSTLYQQVTVTRISWRGRAITVNVIATFLNRHAKEREVEVSVGVQAGLFAEVAHCFVVKGRGTLHNVRLVHSGRYVPLGGAVGGGGQVYSTEVQVGKRKGVHWEGQGGVNAARASVVENRKKGNYLFEHGFQQKHRHYNQEGLGRDTRQSGDVEG